MKYFFAKYRNVKCRLCKKPVSKGSLVYTTDTGGYIHSYCSAGNAQKMVIRVKTGCVCGSLRGIYRESDCNRCKMDFDNCEKNR